MQVAQIIVDGLEERVIVEFQGEFQTMELPMGELRVNGESAVFKCGNVYLQGYVVQMSRPQYVFAHSSGQECKYLHLRYVIRRKILFAEEPNYYEK